MRTVFCPLGDAAPLARPTVTSARRRASPTPTRAPTSAPRAASSSAPAVAERAAASRSKLLDDFVDCSPLEVFLLSKMSRIRAIFFYVILCAISDISCDSRFFDADLVLLKDMKKNCALATVIVVSAQ